MAEKPILFSGPMVRAILDGRKSMTRRVVKPQMEPAGGSGWDGIRYFACVSKWCLSRAQDGGFVRAVESRPDYPYLSCPYGDPGTELWVRETWQQIGELGPERWTLEVPTEGEGRLLYAATIDEEEPPKWRPSIHMPRWASRIQLKVTGVRVERVQDISEEDAKAEGVSRNSVFDEDWWQGYREINGDFVHQVVPGSEPPEWMIEPKIAPAKHLKQSYRDNFAGLWDSINAGRGYSWESNPYVWVIEFERAAPVGAEPS